MRLSRTDLKRLAGRIWRSATQQVISIKAAGMVLALVMDILIAARLGTSGTADALFIALTLPLFVDTVTRESANYSLVPIFVEKRQLRDDEEYHRFVSALLNTGLALGLLLAAATALAAPAVVRILGPGLPEPTAQRSAQILVAATPMLALAPGITLQGVLLDSERNFGFVALRNAVPKGAVVLGLLLTWSRPDTAFWIAAAYSTGFAVFFLLLHRAAAWTGFRHRWTAWPDEDDLSRVREAIGWPLLGFGVRQGARLVERMLASLVTVGGVSAYYFAFRLFSATQTLIGSSVAVTGLPDFSASDVRGDSRGMAALARKRLKLTALLVAPAAIVVLLFHGQIIEILYARGAFDAESVGLTSDLLFWLGWGILFLSLIPVLQSVLYARQAYRSVFWNMLLMTLLNVGAAWALSRWLGLVGIALAVVLSAAASVGNLAYLVPRSGVPIWRTSGEVDW